MYRVQYRITPNGKWKNTKITSEVNWVPYILTPAKVVRLTQVFGKQNNTSAYNVAIRVLDERTGDIPFNYRSINEVNSTLSSALTRIKEKVLSRLNV